MFVYSKFRQVQKRKLFEKVVVSKKTTMHYVRVVKVLNVCFNRVPISKILMRPIAMSNYLNGNCIDYICMYLCVYLSVLWDTTPRKNRPKVQLNLESIFNKNGNKDGRVPVQAT